MAVLKHETREASVKSLELTTALEDQSALIIKNYDLARTFKEGLISVKERFLDRQQGLLRIEEFLSGVEVLIKESRANVSKIKDDFLAFEQIIKAIIQVASTLEEIAHNMMSIAERATRTVSANPQEAEYKEKTISEMRYLASRIRHAVAGAKEAVSGCSEKFDDTRVRFEHLEGNMSQMGEKVKHALYAVSNARLNHSEEVNYINEIFDGEKADIRIIDSEIEALSAQITDFSMLSHHLSVLHDLALKASAISENPVLRETPKELKSVNTEKINDYVKTYFNQIFETKPSRMTQDSSQTSMEKAGIESISQNKKNIDRVEEKSLEQV